MTRINKVVLSGFKSFQKKTVIPFFDGLTTIVGENGAGKSNLFDAISFVMGRRSSQLRADRLEQLIFNGGERHSPAEEAQVVLHLDNQESVFDRFLGNGSTAPEITLGRRITRSSSTYTFMGRACSRAQVDEILEAAKIDPDGQQLIAQGMITDIIKKNPVRRREILDEVSGIASYDEKRREAIAELKEVKSKLNTHRVILAERRRRLVALAHEREAAQEHQRLTEEQGRLAESIRHAKRQKIEEKTPSGPGGAHRDPREDRGARGGGDEARPGDREQGMGDRRDPGGESDGEGQIGLVKEVERLRSEILHKQGEIEPQARAGEEPEGDDRRGRPHQGRGGRASQDLHRSEPSGAGAPGAQARRRVRDDRLPGHASPGVRGGVRDRGRDRA